MDDFSIEEALAEYGRILEVPAGRSMEPMLRDRRDTMVLAGLKREPRRGDVVLFRDRSGGHTLHRVIKKKKDGYLTRGDNCVRSDGVCPREAVVGILEGFYKGEKYYDCSSSPAYKLYVAYVRLSYLPRRAANGARSLLKKLKRRTDEKR